MPTNGINPLYAHLPTAWQQFYNSNFRYFQPTRWKCNKAKWAKK